MSAHAPTATPPASVAFCMCVYNMYMHVRSYDENGTANTITLEAYKIIMSCLLVTVLQLPC